MRILQNLAIGTVLLSVAAWAGSASQSPTPYDARPDDPYAVTAMVTPAQNDNYTVHVCIVEKKTGQVISSPNVTLQPGLAAEIFSDRIPGKPELHTRMQVDKLGRASVTFEAYERVIQRSAVSAQVMQ